MNVLFETRGGGWYGWLIRLWTRSPYIHCELEFSDKRRFTSLAGVGACFRAPLRPEEEFGWKRLFVAATPEQEQRMYHFCQGEEGCPYDWTGIILTQVLGLGRESPTKWFCSEVCDAALLHELPQWPHTRPCKVSPKKLANIIAGRRETP